MDWMGSVNFVSDPESGHGRPRSGYCAVLVHETLVTDGKRRDIPPTARITK